MVEIKHNDRDKIVSSNYRSAMREAKLTQCPFCKCRFVEMMYNQERKRFYIACVSCNAKSGECAYYAEAIRRWNMRRITI